MSKHLPKVLSDDRAMHILNEVSECWWEGNGTGFATKEELCGAIHWLRDQQAKDMERKTMALGSIATIAMLGGLYADVPGVRTLAQMCGETP